MAKKTKNTEVEPTPQVVEQPEVEEIVIEKPKRLDPKGKMTNDGWEIKNRIYRLKGGKKPLSRMIRSANIHWFD